MHWLTCQISALKIPTHKPYIFLMVMINCIDLHIRQVQFTLRWPLRPVGLLLILKFNFYCLILDILFMTQVLIVACWVHFVLDSPVLRYKLLLANIQRHPLHASYSCWRRRMLHTMLQAWLSPAWFSSLSKDWWVNELYALHLHCIL